ncbi:energy transducer TonB [Tenacibaculum agarivorans]|uniref:hypothetical protein n=1 Tax=Tenacibaculum agarivorans TaxID=1908389 RepID=UPI00094B796A|nr:hypothetical protein [Tenacibaculum agarivorans]
MNVKFSICFLGLIVCFSCDYISGKVNTSDSIANDTIVDFSTVDVSPWFKECSELLEDEKTNCFRTNVREKFTEELKLHDISSEQFINEVVTVILIIDKEGNMQVQDIDLSELIQEQIPQLPDVLDDIVANMPKLYPAIKRGIPVTTQYKLPINIKTKERK